MALTITLQPEFEARLREEAFRRELTAEHLLAQKALEAELLWNIRAAAPETETRLLHRLLRKQKAGTLRKRNKRNCKPFWTPANSAEPCASKR